MAKKVKTNKEYKNLSEAISANLKELTYRLKLKDVSLVSHPMNELYFLFGKELLKMGKTWGNGYN
jgi:hypothetical protein